MTQPTLSAGIKQLEESLGVPIAESLARICNVVTSNAPLHLQTESLFDEALLGQMRLVKPLIEEEFGDGIMSAIDFDVALERLPHEKGGRVRFTLGGKFLPARSDPPSAGMPRRSVIDSGL